MFGQRMHRWRCVHRCTRGTSAERPVVPPAGSRSILRYAVPMSFASSTISARRSSNRRAAPENVNATSSPRSPNTAPSTAESPRRNACRAASCCRECRSDGRGREDEHANEQRTAKPPSVGNRQGSVTLAREGLRNVLATCSDRRRGVGISAGRCRGEEPRRPLHSSPARDGRGTRDSARLVRSGRTRRIHGAVRRSNPATRCAGIPASSRTFPPIRSVRPPASAAASPAPSPPCPMGPAPPDAIAPPIPEGSPAPVLPLPRRARSAPRREPVGK